jgi:hypothetical protein
MEIAFSITIFFLCFNLIPFFKLHTLETNLKKKPQKNFIFIIFFLLNILFFYINTIYKY